MMYWGNHTGTGGWIFSILGTLIILGLIVALIAWAVSPRSDGGSAWHDVPELDAALQPGTDDPRR